MRAEPAGPGRHQAAPPGALCPHRHRRESRPLAGGTARVGAQGHAGVDGRGVCEARRPAAARGKGGHVGRKRRAPARDARSHGGEEDPRECHGLDGLLPQQGGAAPPARHLTSGFRTSAGADSLISPWVVRIAQNGGGSRVCRSKGLFPKATVRAAQESLSPRRRPGATVLRTWARCELPALGRG